MSYELYLSAKASKYLKKLNKTIQTRIIETLEFLSEDPYPPDRRKIIGRKEDLFRIRVGDYRILYLVYEEEQMILIVNIDKRSRVYR